MRARWASFGVGVWLIFAPLVLGYPTAAAVLHEVALGLFVCVAALAALEWPAARIALAAAAVWLLAASDLIDWGSRLVAANELASGVAVFVLALMPAGARAPAQAQSV